MSYVHAYAAWLLVMRCQFASSNKATLTGESEGVGAVASETVMELTKCHVLSGTLIQNPNWIWPVIELLAMMQASDSMTSITC